MSKCDLSVVVDPRQRNAVAGDTISGRARLMVNQDCVCRKLTITLLWATHGKGNRIRGPVAQITPIAGELVAGKEYTFPFEFVMPGHPFTYHGHFLNVDWTIRAQVDLPWASDPVAEAEIALVPGGLNAMVVPTHLPGAANAADVLQLARSKRGFNVGCLMIIAVGLFVGGIASILIPPVTIILWAAGGLILFLGIRNALAEKKLGPVSVEFDRQVFAPRDQGTFTIILEPRRPLSVNGIVATLMGCETVVRGSGTKKTTHTHVLHKETIQVMGQADLSVGPQKIAGVFEVPDTEAYSFEARDNNLRWSLGIKIDIPKWPDWSFQLPFVVWPSAETQADRAPSTEKPEPPTAQTDETEMALHPPTVETGDSPLPEHEISRCDDQQGKTPTVNTELIDQFDQLVASGSVFSDRDQIVNQLKGRLFCIQVVVDRVERTTSFDAAERFQDGRTVLGSIKGSAVKIALRYPPRENARLDELDKGSTVEAKACVVAWDSLFERLQMEAD